MSEEVTKSVGHFLCAFCDEKVDVDDLKEIKNFHVGFNLFCPKCYRRVTTGVINNLIKDTSIPKTYRKIFENYLKWREKK